MRQASFRKKITILHVTACKRKKLRIILSKRKELISRLSRANRTNGKLEEKAWNNQQDTKLLLK